MPVPIKTIITADGTITTAPLKEEDYPRVRGRILSIATGVADSGPVVEAACSPPEDTEAIAQRLARLFLHDIS